MIRFKVETKLLLLMSNNPFCSFWMAGYECTDQLNAFGNRVDFLEITGHLQRLQKDYNDLKTFNIRTVREGIRWSKVEQKPYIYNWEPVRYMIETAKEQGIQQVWDICHFGFPDDLTPLHPMFTPRFTSLCRAFVKFYRSVDPDGVLIVTPINEVSFLSWLGGDARGTSPYCINQGWEVKYRLMKAYIEGSKAMREEDKNIRLLTTEPLVNIVPPLNASPQEILDASTANDNQFQSIEMLCGHICPELGGSPDLLDMLGFNFYYNNQWIIGFQQFLPWRNLQPDPRWKPLRQLLKNAYLRYGKPIVLTETSHPKEDRGLWMDYIGNECAALIRDQIPFYGVCLYPIIDRPDWDDLVDWHHAGLWDAIFSPGEIPNRILFQPYAKALLQAQELLEREKLIAMQSTTSTEEMYDVAVVSDMDVQDFTFNNLLI